jgi:hypothetical protein
MAITLAALCSQIEAVDLLGCSEDERITNPVMVRSFSGER